MAFFSRLTTGTICLPGSSRCMQAKASEVVRIFEDALDWSIKNGIVLTSGVQFELISDVLDVQKELVDICRGQTSGFDSETRKLACNEALKLDRTIETIYPHKRP
jgi:hypothetical protein